MLKIILGSVVPENGSVTIDGIQVPNRALRKRIGFMPQQDGLYPELSVYDNLKFFAGIQNLYGAAFQKSASTLLEVVGLIGEEKKLIQNCSGGMKKRVSLAAALIHSPELLILDEPTVGIDPVLRRQIWNYLRELKSQGKTLIVTTHVMDEIFQCDTAALLRNGKIIIQDTVEQLSRISENGNIENLFFQESFPAAEEGRL